jgi:hypothetical protein
MREPVFNETLQLGIVVRDLEATMRRYVDDFGIGPWEVYGSMRKLRRTWVGDDPNAATNLRFPHHLRELTPDLPKEH